QYSNSGSLTGSQNLFLDLMQEIASELNLRSCWICGGLNTAERWPWKGESLAPEQLLKWNKSQISKTLLRPEGWVIEKRIFGTICISREG
ncbi:ENR1 protein, partial [Podargus strigoides]|nr:ENR1 protein [Podargus strigoides]